MLRDDGVSCGDYPEQLTCLIFLKMSNDYRQQPWERDAGIPGEHDWNSLKRWRGGAWIAG